jgi:hypothetical protein
MFRVNLTGDTFLTIPFVFVPCRWVTNAAGLAIMSLMGEWLCVRREMSDIPVTSLRNRSSASTSTEMSALKRSDSKSRLLGPNNV